MLANPLYFFVLVLAAAVGASAQADACVLACVQTALANSTCTSFTDLACVCNSTSFKQTAANCLTANCTAADQQTALQLQQQECGTSSSTNTSSPTSNSTKSPSSTSKSSSAIAPMEQLPFLTAVIAIAGVALGGAFAL